MLGALLVLLVMASAMPPTTTPPEVRLLSQDWTVVYPAEFELESSDASALPKLISILDRDEVVPLTNTADLIYPGATHFYGHGWIIDYDLDRLDVRAGWALEELTFENFGFSEGMIRQDGLLATTKTSRKDVSLGSVVPRSSLERRTELRQTAIARAKKWYASNGGRWSRYEAVKAALKSRDAFRHMKALSWLRHGFTTCERLTLENYRRKISPLVKSLSRTGDARARQQASSLLRDRDNYWWRYKTDSSIR